MKKLFTLICAGVFTSALGAAFTACNSEPSGSDPTEVGIAPVPTPEIPDEVADFFRENAGRIARSIFNFYDTPACNDMCVIINRVEELPPVIGYDGKPLQYPSIDFDAHTLVIGGCRVARGGFYIASQNIVIDPEVLIMNVRIGDRGGIQPQAPTVAIFWGLYSKLPELPIQIDAVFEPKK